ncbi:bifunctional hydroxymethylpyrimidine kinase/phosphomethylpyrimidine kinase [Thalassococcus sp. S3]|uniref:bifunctional hydroxymethylpyrimidine kinase/phosphomethylpyrimidine kinase n=1 Tax=Thalassococcus sp. S3 TaxID=2017482 RepID=UPI00102454AF|nr:bifunctional hydroxymethylpyrimidine kinase/phosphomethylpyrimidine kinase [Thalassococcus sp. S3]QBF32890.1 bifunctional hydroxymethylpyrimidine kinase/phosphomethylpyrimidine kinase [Thalassococcus sp. S3]
MIPNVLSIAGSDPSGGAGIQADIKSISANGGYAMAALTALTAQNTQTVHAVELVSPDMVRHQIEALCADIRIDAVKLGMLGDARIIETVADALQGLDAPLVLDPVMVAKSGDRLLAENAVSALRNHLLPRATILTPNLPEAADLLGEAEASNQLQMEHQARALLDLGAQTVLLKGGHLSDKHCPDLLALRERMEWLEGPRVDTKNTHGTGCTLASALATLLAKGHPVPEAARRAKAYVSDAIATSAALDVGLGNGPTHHFHALWSDQTAAST